MSPVPLIVISDEFGRTRPICAAPGDDSFNQYASAPKRSPSESIIALRQTQRRRRLPKFEGGGDKFSRLTRNVSVTVDEDDETITTTVQVDKNLSGGGGTLMEALDESAEDTYDEADDFDFKLPAIEAVSSERNLMRQRNPAFVERNYSERNLRQFSSDEQFRIHKTDSGGGSQYFNNPNRASAFHHRRSVDYTRSGLDFLVSTIESSDENLASSEENTISSSAASTINEETLSDKLERPTSPIPPSESTVSHLPPLTQLNSVSEDRLAEVAALLANLGINSVDRNYPDDESESCNSALSNDSPREGNTPETPATNETTPGESPKNHQRRRIGQQESQETSSVDEYATANESMIDDDSLTRRPPRPLHPIRKKVSSYPRTACDTLGLVSGAQRIPIVTRRGSFGSSSSETDQSTDYYSQTSHNKAPPKPPRTFNYESNWPRSNSLPRFRRRWRHYRQKSLNNDTRQPASAGHYTPAPTDDTFVGDITAPDDVDKSDGEAGSKSIQEAFGKARSFLYYRLRCEEIFHLISILLYYKMIPEDYERKLKSIRSDEPRKVEVLLDVLQERSECELRFLLRYFHMNAIYLDVVHVIECIDSIIKLIREYGQREQDSKFRNFGEELESVDNVSIEVKCMDLYDGQLKPMDTYRQYENIKQLRPMICAHFPAQKLGNLGATAVSNIMQQFRCIHELCLGNNGITREGAYQIANALIRNKTTAHVDLRLNPIGNKGAIYVAGALDCNPSVKSLNLSHIGMTKDGCREFSKALLGAAALTSIDLSYNELGNETFYIFAAVLQSNHQLSSLRLRHCNFTSDGFDVFADALHANTSLSELDLSKNCIGDRGALHLVEALVINTQLTVLNLEQCAITGTGAAAILAALKQNITLTQLDLSANPLHHTGARDIATVLPHVSNLESLSLNYCSIGNSGFLHLLEALQMNNGLTSLKLGYNDIGVADKEEVGRVPLEVLQCELRECLRLKPNLRIQLWGNSM